MSITIGNSLCDQLRLQSPVSMNGPFPAIVRPADVGDLIQLQICSVPGIDPSPVSARVTSPHGSFAFVEAVITGGAVYHPSPGETVIGVVGTTNYSVFLKAVRSGNDELIVEIRLSDGSRRRIPFTFLVS